MLALLLILLGISARFLPHAPNVQPVAAIALFASVYLPNRRLALIIPLCLMIVSDLFLGLHDLIVYTWGSVFLISILGSSLKKSPRTTTVLFGSLASSLVFFVVTNFGVWISGWYPRTAEGLRECYIMALPFFRNFLAGTLIYSAIFFAAYEVAAKVVRRTKWAHVLLTV